MCSFKKIETIILCKYREYSTFGANAKKRQAMNLNDEVEFVVVEAQC